MNDLIPTDIPWGVVATVAEPAPLVMAFVAHHITLGASEVHIYLDDPSDPVGDLLEPVPQVRLTRCTPDYWIALMRWRPRRHVNRQSANASRARRECKVRYLLHCDADEFLRPTSRVSEQLAEVPAGQKWLKVFNHERALIRGTPQASLFDGVFKVHDYKASDTPLRTTEMTPFGFTGHAAGKPFVHTRYPLEIGIHVPRFGHVKARRVPPHHRADKIFLVHFDGVTPLHWAAKFVRQAAFFPERLQQLTPFRIAQCQRVFTYLDDPPALRALYDELNGYDPSDVAALERGGHMVRDPFDLSPALEAVFPGQKVDLSPEGFDEILRHRVHSWRKKARRKGVEI